MTRESGVWTRMRSFRARLGRFGRARAADLLELALPQRCPGCGAPVSAHTLLCESCLGRVPKLGVELCARCLVAEREPAGCRRHEGFAVWAAWVYDERAALAIQALKYQGRLGLAWALGETMAAVLPGTFEPDLVLEVPLHPVRQRERGYNQAARLADGVARRLGAPRLPDAIARVRATREQARLGPRERRLNPRGAFAVREPRALKGRTVLIVDDVLTTGATLEACLAELRDAGAKATAAALAWAQ